MNADQRMKPDKESLWTRMWRRPTSWWRFGIPAGGLVTFVAGILFWGGFNWTLEMTNTEAFCTSCH